VPAPLAGGEVGVGDGLVDREDAEGSETRLVTLRYLRHFAIPQDYQHQILAFYARLQDVEYGGARDRREARSRKAFRLSSLRPSSGHMKAL
jgi:hypothetical protein